MGGCWGPRCGKLPAPAGSADVHWPGVLLLLWPVNEAADRHLHIHSWYRGTDEDRRAWRPGGDLHFRRFVWGGLGPSPRGLFAVTLHGGSWFTRPIGINNTQLSCQTPTPLPRDELATLSCVWCPRWARPSASRHGPTRRGNSACGVGRALARGRFGGARKRNAGGRATSTVRPRGNTGFHADAARKTVGVGAHRRPGFLGGGSAGTISALPRDGEESIPDFVSRALRFNGMNFLRPKLAGTTNQGQGAEERMGKALGRDG